ncbi:MAG: hypothetical protein GX275_03225 [Clostridiales bacterium]|nr:hypothetical protein [Clostridiales bacterium]
MEYDKGSENCRDKKENDYSIDKSCQCCGYNDKKNKCCCDITKLKEILLFYKFNNSGTLLITENAFLNNQLVGKTLFVKLIKKDIVYLSADSVDSPVSYIIPLDTILFVVAVVNSKQNSFIESIANREMKEKEKCCSLDGIVKAIKEALNYFQTIKIAIGDIGFVQVAPLLQMIEAHFNWYIGGTSFVFSGVNIVIGAVTKEIILISLSRPGLDFVVQFVISTCLVTGVNNEPRVNLIFDKEGKFNISEKDAVVLTLDVNGKIINFADIGVEIKGKTMEEVMKIVNSKIAQENKDS